jgi:hypothetical protein
MGKSKKEEEKEKKEEISVASVKARLFKDQSLADNFIEAIAAHPEKEAVFRIITAGNHAFLCKVKEVGRDYIEVLDDGGKIVAISTSSGIATVCDVTDDAAYVFKGDR